MKNLLLSEQSQRFVRADPQAVSDYLNRHLGRHRLQIPRRERALASLSHRTFASVDLCRLRYSGGVRILSNALQDVFHLQVLLKGRCLWRMAGGEQSYQPGELLLINPNDPVDLLYSEDCEKLIVKLPVSLLRRACQQQRWIEPEKGIRFVNRPALHEYTDLTSLLGLICQEAELATRFSSLEEHYLQILAGKMLACLPSNVRPWVPETLPASFRRLTDYIEEHLTAELGVRQLASLACLSERSLYALFERVVGLAPMEFVRQRRLERIHQVLGDSRVPARSVTQVALDHGFLHLGRFSSSYKTRFGELPSATWRRRGEAIAKSG